MTDIPVTIYNYDNQKECSKITFSCVEKARCFLNSVYNDVYTHKDENGVMYFKCYFCIGSMYRYQRWVIINAE